MMNRMNRISKRGIQGVFTVLRITLLALALVTFFERGDFGLFFVQKWIWFGIFCFTGGVLLTEWEPSYRALGKIGILSVGLVAIVIMVWFGLAASPTFAKMVGVVAYAYLWQLGSECFSTKLYLEQLRQQFIITLGILFLFGIVQVYAENPTVHMEITRHYLPLYLVMGLLHLYAVNVNDVYATTEMNAVNKERNLSRLNAVAALLVSVMFLFMQTGFVGVLTSERLKSVRDAIVSGIATFFAVMSYPFMWLIERFIFWLKAIIEKNRTAASENLYGGAPGTSNADVLPVRETEVLLTPEMTQFLTVVIWIVVFTIVAYMFYRAYKRNRPEKLPAEIDEEGEERTFVFDIAEWFKGARPIKAAMDHLLHPLSHAHLSPIRQRYIAFLILNRENGHRRLRHMTPSTYLQYLKSTTTVDASAEELTRQYNEERY